MVLSVKWNQQEAKKFGRGIAVALCQISLDSIQRPYVGLRLRLLASDGRRYHEVRPLEIPPFLFNRSDIMTEDELSPGAQLRAVTESSAIQVPGAPMRWRLE